MSETIHGVVVFHDIHTLFVLQRELERRGTRTRAVPTPRQLSSDCGSALLFPVAEAHAVRTLIAELELEVRGVYELEE